MKTIVKDNSNNIFFKIKEDLKNCLSIFDDKTEATSLDEYESSDFETVQILKESDKKLNKLATELRESIGVTSKPNSKQKNKEQFKSSTTAKRNSSIGTINPILHNNSTNTIDKHISLIKPNEREL